MIKIKNAAQVSQQLDLWVKRQGDMFVQEYRDLVWAIFLRLLKETPQYTGHAVASWNIGVGVPDMRETTYRSDVVDEPVPADESTKAGAAGKGLNVARWEHPGNVREKGDSRAIEAAKRRNAPKLMQIKPGSKVFFTNTARGDMSSKVDKAQGFAGETFYLEALQSNSYWHAKLRAENKPYETVNESVVAVQEKMLGGGVRSSPGSPGLHKDYIKGGKSFSIGGDTWEKYL